MADLAEALDIYDAGSSARLDFSETLFFCPVGVAWLEAQVLKARSRGVNVHPAVGQENNEKYRYLLRTRTSLASPAELSTRRTIPLQHFPRRDIGGFVEYLRSVWLRQLRRLGEHERGYLVTTVGEIFENVFLHAESPVGAVVVGQHYAKPFSPSKAELHLAVVDVGRSIPVKISESMQRESSRVDHAEALRVAFQPHLSTDGLVFGTGLPMFRKFIEKNDAEVELYSGRGWATIGRSSNFRNNSFTVPGTAYDMILRGIDWVPGGEETFF
jgi:hypothetical protein